MNKTIGKCSICGGDVKIATIFHSINEQVPTCSSCGARKKEHLPIVEMEKLKENYDPKLLVE